MNLHFPYLFPHFDLLLLVRFAVGVIEVVGEFFRRRPQVARQLLLLHAFAILLGGSPWAVARVAALRVDANVASVARRRRLPALVDV